jgi:tripartite-type tricarboxylate transporter receptor subunit TctC
LCRFDGLATAMRKKQRAVSLSRRRLLALSGAALAFPALSRLAQARSYPTRAVRLIVGYAAGGATDITARVIGERLSDRLGQQFLIENRPGAATNIATEQVIRATPDGYTLLMASAANAINATLYDHLNFDFVRDMAAVAGVVRMQNVLEVHPSVPVSTVPELIAYTKTNPDKLSVGSAGIGSPGHVSAELFKMMTGAKMLHVPYRGIAPALSDLLAGRIHVLVDNMATAIEHIKSGKVRALGVTTSFRSPLLPDVPTIDESVPGYEASSWYGVTAPKDTPPEIVNALNAEINALLTDRAVIDRFAGMGAATLPGSPADFSKLLADETDKWGRVVRFAGAKAS